MPYPPQLPAVLLSAFNPIEGSPSRRPRRAAGAQTSHTGPRLKKPETTIQLGRGRLHLRRQRSRTRAKVQAEFRAPTQGRL